MGSYFVSTAMGFITNINYTTANPKRCVNQSKAGDVRWAYPFRSWDEANNFATLLTTAKFWPNEMRYYAVLSPVSPNAKPIVTEAPVPAKKTIGERVRAFMA
jgi:hypothetical protein